MDANNRAYIPPVFHTLKADTSQLSALAVVFSTLKNSGIDFCIVHYKEGVKNELIIEGIGDFSDSEKRQILSEVAQIYISDRTINYVSME